MKKLQIFISSRVNSTFSELDREYSLKDLREFLHDELEKITLFGEMIFEVIINENSFNADFSQNAFENCLSTMQKANVIIMLYNGKSGWDVGANGICHDEFLLATQIFPGMSYAIDLTRYFNQGDPTENDREFRNEVEKTFVHMESMTSETVDELQTEILLQIKGYLLSAIEKSFATQKAIDASSSVFGPTLDWSKLNYSQRQQHITEKVKKDIKDAALFNDTILRFHSISDNMSVADARNRIGRPFLYEYQEIKSAKEKKGVIHIVGIYGSATEIQVKNLVGFPDLVVIKGSFGFYLWEQTSHIQIFFLNKCINPSAIGTRVNQLTQWIRTSGEQKNIAKRAKARYSILKAIEKSADIANL